jgi:hypothetical protein
MTTDIESIQIFKQRGVKAAPSGEAPKAQAAVPVEVSPQAPLEQQAVQQQAKAAAMKKEEEKKLKEEEIEQEISKYYIPIPDEFTIKKKLKEKILLTHMLSRLAGVVMLVNSTVFAFFIYPQSMFIMNYMKEVGPSAFFNTLNYTYSTGFLDILLLVATFISGLIMLTKFNSSHIIAGFVSSVMLVAVTFEYLSSNANYLLGVSMLTFVGIGVLTFSRISAGSIEEESLPTHISWPRPETF